MRRVRCGHQKTGDSLVSGFTLIEMLISLFIIISISAITLLNYNKVNSRISLENKASEMAIWIRQAQAYAMGIKTQGSTIYWSYGVNFSASSPSNFTLYVDKFNSSFNFSFPDKIYNLRTGYACGDANSECITQVQMPTGMNIDQMCVKKSASNEVCTGIQWVDISYTRPRPDAKIVAYDGTANDTYDQARIRLRSPTGFCKRILIMSSGQIGIDIAACP